MPSTSASPWSNSPLDDLPLGKRPLSSRHLRKKAFPGSSAVERSTVNRMVACSNQARGAISVSWCSCARFTHRAPPLWWRAMAAFLLLATIIDLSEIVSREVRRSDCEDGAAASDSILVCGVRRRPNDPGPYRIIIPDNGFDPTENALSVASERSRWGRGGETGAGSCGPVGPGGWTGCMAQGWRQQRQQHGGYH
jgi:hypothetical protein